MKRYQSHKIVDASQIIGMSFEDGKKYVIVESENKDGYEIISVPDDFYARGKPSLGDYLVRYLPDGYLSWSPRKAFEEGYTFMG